MIVFDLECKDGHAFEGWFSDSADFESQMKRGLICCPVCNETSVSRKLSPVAIRTNSGSSQPVGPNPAKQFQHFLQKMADFVDKNFEDVGCNFATEALKMHYGATEQRNIRGTSTDTEEKMLKEEGIGFLKVPVPVMPDTDS
ncbi:MAG: DUF1178 family protein [Desulfatibacillaceae bacterium]|nr:DUF1178 family protein [Desulfatibacillaceae bacterium]